MSDTAASPRSQAKADRRAALLRAAATLFAEHGYSGVSLEDLGAAAGISGPAVYRHFPGKQAVLSELLIGVSENLLRGGQRVIEEHAAAASALSALIDFHVRFALADADVIRVQDRDLAHLDDAARHSVRSLQRRYSELWVDALARIRSELSLPERRTRVQAVFGLINSTPYSSPAKAPDGHRILHRMALAAILTD